MCLWLHVLKHTRTCLSVFSWKALSTIPFRPFIFPSRNSSMFMQLEIWKAEKKYISGHNAGLFTIKKKKSLRLRLLCERVPECAAHCPGKLPLTLCVSSWALGAKGIYTKSCHC